MPARARMALLGAGASAVVLVLIWLVALHTAPGEHTDRSVFIGFAGLRRPSMRLLTELCNPVPFVCLAAAALSIAIIRGRYRLALGAGAVLLGANLTTHLLKPLLAQPRADGLLAQGAHPSPAAWPSGHATAAMSLALAFVLVVPARRRPTVAALGAVFAVAVSYSLIALRAHFPSDVLGGFFVAGMWTMLAIAALLTLSARRARPASPVRRHQPSVREALTPAAVAAGAGTALAALVALTRPQAAVGYAGSHALFVFGAATIGGLALALATAVMLSVRR